MRINKVKVEKLAKLAQLSFSKVEANNMFLDFKKILKFIDKLDEINTDNVKPLTHIHNKTNIYREDRVMDLDIKDSILENSPNHNSDYIKVPKILKKK